MNQIDVTNSAVLAGALFDEGIAPFGKARRDAGAAPYFAQWKDPAAASYYETCQPSEATAADLDRSEMTGATELIDALVAHWTQEGEVALAAFGPRLQAIAKALGQEQAAQGDSVDILCYTMF